MPDPTLDERQDGAYICAECGHGERLFACAGAVVSGRLLPDGSVEESHSDQWGTFEDSIQCDDHPGARLLRWFDGRLTAWVPCTHAENHGHCEDGAWFIYRQRYGLCAGCGGRGGRDVPVEEASDAA